MTRIGRSGALHRLHPEAGSTLIEIMAALVILAIAMTAVFATFTTQQQSFTSQSRVAEMQQNLRLAVDYMSRDLRMAGYGMPDNVTIPSAANQAGITTIRSLFAADNTTGPDQIYVLYLYDMDANQPPAVNTVAMPSAGPVTVDNAAGFLAAGGELVLVTDRVSADLYQTTSATATVLNFGGDYAGAWHTKIYGTNSQVAKARFVRYFIDSTTDPAHPRLMVDRNITTQSPQPVADDIEDLQLAYGLDADGDISTPLTWISSPAGAQWAQIRQIRLMIMARSPRPDRNWTETRPALGNHPGGATTDGYRRRIIDVVIDVRNSGA
jgi:type IV pilus assembly protein PilW